MRKIISFIVLIFAFSCVICYATEAPTILLVRKETENVTEICIDVQLSENSKACGGKIDISYDKSLLKPEKYEIADSFSIGMFLVNLNYNDNTIRLSWAGTEEISVGGTMCTLTFSLVEDKSFSTIVDISQCKIADINSEPISVDVQKCEIAYTKKSAPSTPSRPSGIGSLSNKDNEKQEIAEAEEKTIKFSDVKESDWYYEAVKFAFEKGITSGVSETSYAPNDKVTRGQFITMLCRAYGIKEMTGDNFVDCGNTWYTGYLAAAKQFGISNGVGDNKFAPEKEITREEMVTLIYNYLKSVGKVDEEISETTFADDSSISSWAKNGVAFASSKGYVNGKGDNLFDPNGDATRAELAQIFFNMFK